MTALTLAILLGFTFLLLRKTANLQKAQKALAKSESYLKNIFDASPDAIFIHDGESFEILDVNEAACQLHGGFRTNLIGKQPSDFWQSEKNKDLPSISAVLQQAKEKGQQRIIQFSQRLDGKHFWAELDICFSKIGDEERLIVLERDISNRKKREQELLAIRKKAEKSAANMKALIENVSDGIWAIDRQYKLIYMNNVLADDFENVFGIKLKKGDVIIELLPENLANEWRNYYERVFSGEHFRFEQKIEIGQSVIFIEIHANPIFVEGEVIGASFFGRDITEAKHYETQLQEALARAEENEERYRTIFNASPDAYFLLREGAVFYCNDAAEKMFLAQPGQLIGKTPLELSPKYQENGRLSSEEVPIQLKKAEREGTFFDWRH